MNTHTLRDKLLSTTSTHTRAVLAVIAVCAMGAAGAQPIRATVDQVDVDFIDVQPMMINERVMVPVRGVFEHMEADVVWDQRAQVVNASRGTDMIRMAIGANRAAVNGRTVQLDAPASLVGGRAMIPLRFLSEALGCEVTWMARSRTVEITTNKAGSGWSGNEGSVARLGADTVVPFKINERLSSSTAVAGHRFTATLRGTDPTGYQGIPVGSKLVGHVEVVRAKAGTTPGVLGLAFDRIVTPGGKSNPISGTLIGLDSSSVTNEDGRLIAKDTSSKNNLKFVGYGAGAGALMAILTKGNLLTNTLIGGALGFLVGEIEKDPAKARDVTLEPGAEFGVMLTRDLTVRLP